MIKENEIKVMKFPKAPKGKLKMPVYLIHNIDNYNFFIYREITKEESRDKKEYELLHHKDSIYLMIANTPSEENAMLAIKSYWQAILQLERIV